MLKALSSLNEIKNLNLEIFPNIKRRRKNVWKVIEYDETGNERN